MPLPARSPLEDIIGMIAFFLYNIMGLKSSNPKIIGAFSYSYYYI